MSKIAAAVFLLLLTLNIGTCRAATLSQPEQMMSAPPASCGAPGATSWPGLTLSGGYVTGAAILNEIDSYARSAGTTGGLGGRLMEVTTTADYNQDAGEKAITGLLRYIVQEAAHVNSAVWVTFSPVLGRSAVITLKAPLHIGSNVTIDGTCANVTIQGISDGALLEIENTHNILIDRIKLTNNLSDLPVADPGSAIRLGGTFDAVAILHNELSECGDKCIAVTSGAGDPVPAQARVTVAFNYIHDHDLTLLFGTYNCLDGDDCTVQEALNNAASGPALFMTLEGNALIRDAQRNPRVFGRAMLHAFDNYIAFQPYVRPSGVVSASYGILVSNGARALIEHNWLVPLNPKKLEAIFTQGTPGTSVPVGDRVGEIRLAGGLQGAANAIIAQSAPQEVLSPYYIYHAIPLETLPPSQALACIASRAGRNGAAAWSSSTCPSS